jgi:hypothetical protein
MSVAAGIRWFSLLLGLTACHQQQKIPALVSTRPALMQKFAVELPGLDVGRGSVDFSRMNAEPAGARGFVRPVDGHFADETGRRLRFFGVNLAGSACLPEPESAPLLARRLSQLGVNAVRLSGLDAPNALGADASRFTPATLEHLDALCAALKAQGIYFAIELHARGSYVALEPEARARFPTGKMLDRFTPALLDEQRAFAKALLTRENAVTHVRYVDEPALLFVELASEDTLLPSAGGSPDNLPERYREELARRYRAWLSEQTAAGARAPGPALEEAKQELPTLQASEPARSDYLRFLRDLELASVRSLREYVKQELGLKSMLANSQASAGGLLGVLREAAVSDFVDVHGYWDVPQPNAASPDSFTIDDTSQIQARDGGVLGLLASYRVAGMPFVVSEYALPAPSKYTAEMLPMLSAVAAFQDWDAIFAYAYAERPSDFGASALSGPFSIVSDPAKLTSLPAAALAFRRGLVAVGAQPLELSVSRESAPLAYETRSMPELWRSHDVPTSSVAVRRLGARLTDAKGEVKGGAALHVAAPYSSSTGELYWEPEGPHARFSVNAPALKVACGELSDTRLRLGAVLLSFESFQPGYACVTLVSLDDEPVETSKRLLLTAVGQIENTIAIKQPRFNSLGAGPPLAQYVPLTITLPGRWQATALDLRGTPTLSLSAGGATQSELRLPAAAHALSFLLTSR